MPTPTPHTRNQKKKKYVLAHLTGLPSQLQVACDCFGWLFFYATPFRAGCNMHGLLKLSARLARFLNLRLNYSFPPSIASKVAMKNTR
jgi:hypothetical protein